MKYKFLLLIVFIGISFSQSKYVDREFGFHIMIPEGWSVLLANQKNDEGLFRTIMVKDLKNPLIDNFDIYIADKYELDPIQGKNSYVEKFKNDLKYDVSGEVLLLGGRKVLELSVAGTNVSSFLLVINSRLFVINFKLNNTEKKREIISSITLL